MKFRAPSSDQIFLGQDQAFELARRARLPSSGSLSRIRINRPADENAKCKV
jgi:hypothetical protein